MNIRKQAILLSVVPLVCLLAILILAATVVSQTGRTTAYSARSDRVLGLTALVLNEIESLDRTLGTYQSGDRRRAVVAFNREMAGLQADQRDIRTLTARDPQTAFRAARLDAVLGHVSAFYFAYFRAIRAGNTATARAVTRLAAAQRLGPMLLDATTALNDAQRKATLRRLSDARAGIDLVSKILLGSSAAAILLTLFTTARFGLRIARRLENLARDAARIGEGASLEEPLRGDDEITHLESAYRKMAANLKREQRVASTLQRALLPQVIPSLPGVRIETEYIAAAKGVEIGGDWYDAFLLDDDRLAISVGDVAGHGLKAATAMGSLRQAIRTAAREHDEPGAVLGVANRMICAEHWETLATAFYGTLDLRSGMLVYANAGHPPPLLVAGPQTEYLGCEGLILGVDERTEFPMCRRQMTQGQILVLYTDGLIEIEHDLLKGMEDLQRAAGLIEPATNAAKAIRERITARLAPSDDCAILSLHLTTLHSAHVPDRKHWTFDARDAAQARTARAEVVAFLHGTRANEDAAASELIFSELVGNVAKHAAGMVDVEAERNGANATLRVGDRGGKAFAVDGGPIVEPLAESGRGLHLVREIASDLRVERLNGGNRVSAVFPVRSTEVG